MRYDDPLENFSQYSGDYPSPSFPSILGFVVCVHEIVGELEHVACARANVVDFNN